MKYRVAVGRPDVLTPKVRIVNYGRSEGQMTLRRSPYGPSETPLEDKLWQQYEIEGGYISAMLQNLFVSPNISLPPFLLKEILRLRSGCRPKFKPILMRNISFVELFLCQNRRLETELSRTLAVEQ